MSQFDINCPASFAKAFESLPDTGQPQVYRLADGEHVDVVELRQDGTALTACNRVLGHEAIRNARKMG